MNSSRNYQPLIILVLLAALVITVSLWTMDRSKQQKNVAVIDSNEASQAPEFEWKLVTSWPKNFPGLGTAPERFAQMVNTMSGGRLVVKVFGAKELVPALGVFDAVSQGSVEMGHTAAYYWKGKSAAAPFFTSVPFGLTAQEMNAWLHHGGGMKLWQELYAPFNLIPLAAGNTGVQMAGWFNKEINSVADLNGLVMRIPGIGGEVFKRAGGTAVTISGGDLYTSLKTGVIDATEWVGPYNDLALGLHEVAQYYYYPGWHEPGPTLELMVNKQAFEHLPKDLQEMVRTAARAANQDMLDEYTARNNAALQTLVEQHQVQLRRLPDDVLARLQQLSQQVLTELVADDEFAQKVYASYAEFAIDVKAYHRYSEQAYINGRDLGSSGQ